MEKERRKLLGEILVEAGLLSQESLEEALVLQKNDGRRLGTILLERNYVSEPHLLQALSRQLSIPWVSLWHIDIDEELIKKVPFDIAEQYCLIPIYVRQVKGKKTLYVAMDDPTNEEAIRFVTSISGMPVKAMIASPSEIQSAIKDYYDIEKEENIDEIKKAFSDANLPISIEDDRKKKERLEKERLEKEKIDREKKISRVPIAPPSTITKKAEDKKDLIEESMKDVKRDNLTYKEKPKTRTLSFTFLDGTTISFGSKNQPKPEDKKKISIDEIMDSLKARAKGEMVPLPVKNLESVLSGILELLIKKGIITKEELNKVLAPFIE